MHFKGLWIVFISLFSSVAFLNSCSKDADSTDGSSSALLPSVLSAVDKASPSTFVNGTVTSTGFSFLNPLSTPADASEALKDFITDNVMSISGITGKGIIRTYIRDLEERMKEIKSSSENPEGPTCFSSHPQDVLFDSGLTDQSLTLKLSCVKSFGGTGDQSGAGSGVAFGKDDTFAYLYLLLVQPNGTDKFGYVAKVNLTTEEVDLLFLEYFPSAGSRKKFFRLKTDPASDRYELVIAGTSDGPGPTQTATTHVLSAGARIVTNGTFLRADGHVGTATDSSGTVTSSVAFDNTECFDVTNLAGTPSTCGGSAPTFSSSMGLVSASAMNSSVGTAIQGSLKLMSELTALGIQETN